jgi:hypothetical protein
MTVCWVQRCLSVVTLNMDEFSKNEAAPSSQMKDGQNSLSRTDLCLIYVFTDGVAVAHSSANFTAGLL